MLRRAKPRFPDQRPGEEVLIFLRRHTIVLLGRIFIPVLLLLLAAGSWMLGMALEEVRPVAFVISLITLLPGLFLLGWRTLDWWNDNFIVTTQRVIHIERVQLFFESREEAPLNRIQNVLVKMEGLLPNLLYYGDVVIETAGARPITFKSVSKPRKVQRIIFTEMRLAGQRAASDDATLPPEIPRWESRAPRWRRLPEVISRLFFVRPPEGKIVRTWRKHWWVLLSYLGRPLAILLPLSFLWVVMGIVLQPLLADAIYVIGLVALLLWTAWLVIDWGNDLYILTEGHVIDVKKKPLTLEHRLEAGLSMIQNANYNQPNFLSRALNFGDVIFQTAGPGGELRFESVPDPRNVQAAVLNAVAQARQLSAQEEAQRRQDEMYKVMDKYMEWRERNRTPSA